MPVFCVFFMKKGLKMTVETLKKACGYISDSASSFKQRFKDFLGELNVFVLDYYFPVYLKNSKVYAESEAYSENKRRDLSKRLETEREARLTAQASQEVAKQAYLTAQASQEAAEQAYDELEAEKGILTEKVSGLTARVLELGNLIDHLKYARKQDYAVSEKNLKKMFRLLLKRKPLRRAPVVILDNNGDFYLQSPASRRLNGDLTNVDLRRCLDLNRSDKQTEEIGKNLCSFYVYPFPLYDGRRFYQVNLSLAPAHRRASRAIVSGGEKLVKAQQDLVDVVNSQVDAHVAKNKAKTNFNS